MQLKHQIEIPKMVSVKVVVKEKVNVLSIIQSPEVIKYVVEPIFLLNESYYFFVGNTSLFPSEIIFWNGHNNTVPQFDATLARRHACIRKKTYFRENYTSIENGKYYYINSTGETHQRKRVHFEDGAWNKTISVCEQMAFLTCAEVSLDILKFYDSSEHDFENKTIFMCVGVSEKKIYLLKSKSNVIQIYLSLVCLSLSLACLFLVIQTYLIFPELRNLPGKNLLSLSISLFLAQLLWLIPDQRYSPKLCHVAAIVKHYLFLVSFVAMAIIAWKTHAVFTSNEVPVQRSEMKKREKRKFYKYLAIVWGLPAILVVTCAVVDEREIYAVYVNDLMCWFDNPQAHKYLFILPLGLLQLFNIVLFTLTVFRIQRTHSSTKSVRSDQRKKTMFWIYLKLSSLMGFSWLFGFVHLLVGSSTVVFAYLFVVFSSLQGVYIALAFVMNKRIWKMYAKLLGRNPDKFKTGYSTTCSESLSKGEETSV
ncbi:latrophilin receptor-like protein A [Dendronephthya gigantea]|uniref:latrophilin receptor-like protein A n=1 Tax=Dendronephthya gigantea TaxID=151771 RepID=UPI00106B3316|nr:latrophilin receptor-like protein A [Dendronephthya gigantea]